MRPPHNWAPSARRGARCGLPPKARRQRASAHAPSEGRTQADMVAGTDAFLPQSGSAGLQSPSEQQYTSATAPPAAGGLPQPSFETPRRAPTLGRAAHEELHISTAGPPSASSQQPQAQPQSHPVPPQQGALYNSPDHYRSAPDINVAQATPQNSQYGTPAVPGSLQPGAGSSAQQQRPPPSGTYTSAPVVPTQTQIASNAQQYTLPTRSNTLSQSQHSPHSSHSYSRSSPAGLGPEQKYIPFSNTPEQPKYPAATSAQKYYPTTPSGATSQSPLGLADIRPRANSAMDQENAGHGNSIVPDQNKVPSNSNYLAPWSIYAYDWCKWNVSGGNSAGKMAIGSYLEDNHNFVRKRQPHSPFYANTLARSASSTLKSALKMFLLQVQRPTGSNTPASPKPHVHSPSLGYCGSHRHHRNNPLIS